MKKNIMACEKCNGNCMGCFYTWECNLYNDVAPYNPIEIEIETKTASMALCDGRHSIPEAVDGSVFANEINPLAVIELENEAKNKLCFFNIEKLNLYVTGLTVALIAVLNATRELDIKVTLYHFNRENGEYYRQEVK